MSSSRFLGPIKAVLIDISGTLHTDAIPGAILACKKLYQCGVKILFLTNTSKVSSTTLLEQLRTMGFDETAIPNANSIMSSVGATRQYLVENKLRPYCLVEDDLLQSGDFDGVEMDHEHPNCVLVGLAPSKLNYERLNGAFRLLSRWKEEDKKMGRSSKPRLIAMHRKPHYRDSDHEFSLGPGGFVSLLEQTAGVTAHVIGKPSHNFYQTALSSLRISNAAHAVMIGDDVVGDVKGAFDAGLGAAILVKTGQFVDGDELGQKTDGVLPTLVVDSVVEAVEHISSYCK